MSVEVLPDNNAPVFTSTFPNNAKPQVGKVFQYLAKASDPDGDSVTFELVGAPTGVAINTTTGLLSWTPTNAQKGEQQFQIRVKDNKGGQALSTVKATVIAPIPNSLPAIASNPRTTARNGNTYFYLVLSYD